MQNRMNLVQAIAFKNAPAEQLNPKDSNRTLKSQKTEMLPLEGQRQYNTNDPSKGLDWKEMNYLQRPAKIIED
jgi:hypothetical protein